MKIDVEDDGRVNVASADEASANKAIAIIKELTATPELNKTYLGKVAAHHRLRRVRRDHARRRRPAARLGDRQLTACKDVRDELKEGEQIMVKVINIDPSGKVRLSRKALLHRDEGTAPREPRPVHDGRRRRTGGRERRRPPATAAAIAPASAAAR